MEALQKGDAHATTLDSGDVFVQAQLPDLTPIIMEKRDDGAPAGTYYSVAVVNKVTSNPFFACVKKSSAILSRLGGRVLGFLIPRVIDFASRNSVRMESQRWQT